MDPTRLSNNPPGYRVLSPRGRGASLHHVQVQSGPASHPSSTPLPSIRTLHPNLPPPGMAGGESSGFINFAPEGSPGHDAQGSASHSSSFSRTELGPEEPQPPPKKKRRRQALSCTECKRRKIKCDRNQPCGPCTRRNEQAKCQWHIIEPIEKYVTRGEYDELKARFENLERVVTRLVQPQPTNVPMYSMASQATMPMGGTAAGETSPHYTTHSQSAGVVYQPVMSPIYQAAQHHPLEPQHHRYAAPKSDDMAHESPRYHSSLPSDSARSLSSPQALSPPKVSPLSLASITSPFNHASDRQPHSKNYPAQTLTLGERLRSPSLLQGDPEIISPQVQRRVHPWAPHPIYI